MAVLLEYKCPCCGGAINFDSTLQQMKCPFCDTTFEAETLRAYNEAQVEQGEMNWDNHSETEWREDENGMRTYICQSCGGEVIGDENLAATSCPFCGNPVVMAQNVSNGLRPDVIIPFKLDKKAAKAALMKHYQKKKLLPKLFRDQNHIDEVKGVYVPFWLFTCDADADLRYKATRVRFWSDAKYNYTETSHFLVTRRGTVGFDHVPVDGSTKMPDDLMESVEPFDWNATTEFNAAYLAGYMADKYDVSSEDSIARANARVKATTEAEFAKTVNGYNSVIPESGNVAFKNGDVKYGLLPVWLLNTTYLGKNYLFAMNGQSGKLIGNLPVDKGAYWKWFAIYAGAISAGVFLLLWLINLL